MVGARFLGFVSVFLVLGAGCSRLGPRLEDKLVGNWGLEVTFTDAYKKTPQFKAQEASLKYLTDTAHLELRSDKTYFQSLFIFQIEGQWELKGDVLHLYPTKINGTPIEDLRKQLSQEQVSEMEQPGRFRVSADATQLEAMDEKAKAENPDVTIRWKKKADTASK